MLKKTVLLSSLATCLLANSMQKAELDEVVISASGFEQDADSNLRTVLVLQGKDLASKGFTSLEQALQRVVGLSFISLGVNGNASRVVDMRGQGASANSAVKVMIDNIPTNVLDESRLHAAGTSISPLDSISIDDIERIEIIPGGGAVLYGNGTRGGVINIITKKRKQNAADIALRGSMYENANLDTQLKLNLGLKLNDSISFSSNIQGFNKQGYREKDLLRGFYQNSKLNFDFSDDISLNLGFSYYQGENTLNDALSYEELQANRFGASQTQTTYLSSKPEFNAELKIKANEFLDVNLQAFYQVQKVKLKNSNAALQIYANDSFFKDGLYGANLKGRLSYLENSYLVLGYSFEEHSGFLNSQSLIGATKADDKKQSHSLYALDYQELNDIFSLFLGARYEHANYTHKALSGSQSGFKIDTNTDNFALELGPNARYSDTGKLYAKYERGFISPTPYQFRSRQNGVYYSNTNLKSQRYDTYELGLSDYLLDFYAVNLALFYTNSKDEIRSFGTVANGGFENIDETKRYGVELFLRQDFANFYLYENFSFVNAEISAGADKGKRIPLVSRYKASAGINYDFSKNLSGFVDMSYFSKAKDESNAWIKEYFLSDIGLIYKNKGLDIFAGVKNLFDNKYLTYQNKARDDYIPGASRSYYLEAKYKF
ncbi:TonB-dependent heme receptor [Campylobacter avium LMG 24591]|uniref:TonB-dependent heme receptor n=1 Tax=Campylobacter avium LMG 24591 TaxID=522484 RepID=A0A222MVB5_9BACT|nr:TonB-dependent receptor [Campylobacter avium]ASQ29731.1 TonB-dependent heme receptor [Campylobacter avium LMG 24591]OYD78829.1 TonB-dependent heme receptor [Campylobacter avium]